MKIDCKFLIILNIVGANRLAKNIQLMNGEKPNFYFKACWYVITPSFILIIWGFNWYMYEPIKYGNSYTFNAGAQAFGWCIAMVSIISIPLGALHTFYNAPGKTFKKVINQLYIFDQIKLLML